MLKVKDLENHREQAIRSMPKTVDKPNYLGVVAVGLGIQAITKIVRSDKVSFSPICVDGTNVLVIRVIAGSAGLPISRAGYSVKMAAVTVVVKMVQLISITEPERTSINRG